MRRLFKNRFLRAVALVLALVLVGVGVLYVNGLRNAGELNARPDKGFAEINLPASFTQTSVMTKKHKGDLTTSALVAQARTYKVSMNMTQTRDALSTILTREQDTSASFSAANGDARRSMHPEDAIYQLAESGKTCSPIEIPLKSNTYATVVFGDTQPSVEVGLNEDGQVDDATGAALTKYVRTSCSTTGSESYVTIVMWAM